jgi:hypothetical protein
MGSSLVMHTDEHTDGWSDFKRRFTGLRTFLKLNEIRKIIHRGQTSINDEISGFHGFEYEDGYLLGCYMV